jgi:hypothetical protein
MGKSMSPTETKQLADERRELLMTELLGEIVKVRGMGYKTMKRARVEAATFGDGYRPLFNYEEDARQQDVELIKRLDVMTPKGWATVWDDGKEDVFLMPGETLSTSAKPTNRKYKTGMLA